MNKRFNKRIKYFFYKLKKCILIRVIQNITTYEPTI